METQGLLDVQQYLYKNMNVFDLLVSVTHCQDYSRQIYGVGESWHSLYARMTCGSRGVSSERGKKVSFVILKLCSQCLVCDNDRCA